MSKKNPLIKYQNLSKGFRATSHRASMYYAEIFKDPLAGKTDWFAIEDSVSLRLKKDRQGNLCFKPTLLSNFVPGFLLFIGFLLLDIPVYFVFTSIQEFQFSFFYLVGLFYELYDSGILFLFAFAVVSLAFWSAGFYLLYRLRKPVVFHFQKGYFYRGYLKESEHPRRKKNVVWCPLEEIYALQLLSYNDALNDKTKVYYELNIIKRDSSRISFVQNSKLKELKDEASILVEALNVPLWDGVATAFEA